MNPRISVLMSVYNSEKYLKEALESILSQTEKSFEFLIVDDGSSDASRTIVESFAARDPRIHLIINEKNIGLTKSLNKALSYAKGEYVARMDADDLSYPERFTQQLNFFNTHPLCVLVGTGADIINEQGGTIGELVYPTDTLSLKQDLIKYNPFIHTSIMMKTNILREIDGYDETWRTAQDYELYFRLSQKGDIANLPEKLVAHRFSAHSITSKKNRSQIRAVLRAKIKYITSGLYPVKNARYLIKPLLAYCLPVSFKRFLKKVFA